ncbi:hypothetical protein CC77DRAFT_533489 [Alternaria alternata]|uniref:Uncharacterized protein n=1 Tax=Alternaria alternata TaxID=5599 RepID=A0A177E053_ALTAL|nr:hypothetical protein CC77DRAFT_533489 [Alternaria alternata]KAH6860040.1 hypothetical protein B0T12DRAFT_127800 [Alternaria alternata]OAG24602.1 hypothetical protein CC77DRAFT_533489 [Alternaria alternata]
MFLVLSCVTIVLGDSAGSESNTVSIKIRPRSTCICMPGIFCPSMCWRYNRYPQLHENHRIYGELEVLNHSYASLILC